MRRIAYVSWPADEFSGGIKVTFRHVELLRAAGIDAVVATPDGKSASWFESTAPVERIEDVRDDDVAVLPENQEDWLRHFAARPNPKVVFSQSWSLAFRGLNHLRSYADAGVSHILCPSFTVLQYARQRFPELPAVYMPVFIDDERFVPAPVKKLQVMAVPAKRPVEYGAIHDLFRAVFPQWSDLPWTFAQQAGEGDVARAMGEAAVFLSLGRLEAIGMTPLEAMACNCIVAGFTGVAGGTDTATLRNGFWAREDDLVHCVQQLGRAVTLVTEGGGAYTAMMQAGRETAARYDRATVTRHLVDFWRPFLESH